MRGPPTPALSPPASHTPLSLQRLCGSRRERGQGCSPRQREGVCCLVDQKHQRRKKTRAGGSHVRANGCRERTPPARALCCVAHVRAGPNGGGGGGGAPPGFRTCKPNRSKAKGWAPAAHPASQARIAHPPPNARWRRVSRPPNQAQTHVNHALGPDCLDQRRRRLPRPRPGAGAGGRRGRHAAGARHARGEGGQEAAGGVVGRHSCFFSFGCGEDE